MNIKDFHGPISKCDICTNPETPMECRKCLCRGFVASCMNCGGVGQKREKVAGASAGHMSATCSICGGCGTLPVNKPADWDEQAKEGDKVPPQTAHEGHVAAGEIDADCPECQVATAPVVEEIVTA